MQAWDRTSRDETERVKAAEVWSMASISPVVEPLHLVRLPRFRNVLRENVPEGLEAVLTLRPFWYWRHVLQRVALCHCGKGLAAFEAGAALFVKGHDAFLEIAGHAAFALQLRLQRQLGL